MRKAFNKELLKIAKQDPRVFMILADIGYGEIEEFAETFPDRFINCGVAEQNMTGVACGVAMEGNIAITYSIANFPTLRLSGSLGVSALTLGALTNGASVARSIAASLAAPLFDAGANRAQISAQKAAVEQARQAWRASVLIALQEVEDALVQLQGDQERLLHLSTAAEAAANAQLLAQQRYESGLVDFRTVLDSQRTLLSSQDSLASAQAAINNDYIRLFKALGGGWQAEPEHAARQTATAAYRPDASE